MVEGCVNHAGQNAVGDLRVQRSLARTRGQLDPIAILDPTHFRVRRVNFQHILGMPNHVMRAPCLRAHVILAQNAPRCQQQREARACAFIGCDILGVDELTLAAHKAIDMHQRCAFGGFFVAGPLHRPHGFQLFIADTRKRRRGQGDFFHDLAGMRIGPIRAHCIGEHLGHFPVGIALARGHHLAHAVDAAFGVCECAVFFQKGRTGQEDMGVVCGFVQE